MRRAFMNMFPVDGVSSTPNGQSAQDVLQKKNELKDGEQANTKNKVEVSVFSRFDTSQDGHVKFDEADKNSLFNRADLSSFQAANIDPGLDANAQGAIKKMAMNKMGGSPSDVFNKLMKDFDSKVGSKTLTFKGVTKDNQISSEDQKKVDDLAKGFDEKAIKDARTESEKANDKMIEMYKQYLDAAQTDYAKNNELADDEANQLTDKDIASLKGKDANPTASKGDHANNTKVDIKKTEVFASEDKDQNG